MFEEQYERSTSTLAWTLFVILLVGAGVGGWVLITDLRQCEAQLNQAHNDLKAERGREAIEQATAQVSAQQLAACKADAGACTTSLAAAQGRMKELESAQPAAKQRR